MFEFRSFLTLVLMLQLGARANEDLTTESPDFSKIVVVGTWDFENATAKAFETLKSGFSALDAIERGCSVCEELQCDGTVGYGGSPAENGETVLEAMIMDGKTSKVGAVASMRRIKSAISVARKVLENTKHSILAGDLATEFAKQMGFKEESLETDSSTKMWQDWKANNCQPNFWMNVNPDPTKFCGPYKPIENLEDTLNEISSDFGRSGNHDTIGMIAIDAFGNVASGTSTNGAKFKISGRVGDSPIPGAGSYADNEVGAAAATGDGDVMLRFLPSFLAVELMRNGLTPELACKTAIERITAKYPDFSGAIIAVNVNGTVGASCHGMEEFPFTMGVPEYDEIVLMRTRCV